MLGNWVPKCAIAASHADWSVPALWVFLVSYVVLAGVTWFVYLRGNEATEMQPTPAGASL